MDDELMRLVKAVGEGAIVDADQGRTVLAEAREAVSKDEERLSRMKDLLYSAEQAFVRGWPSNRRETG